MLYFGQQGQETNLNFWNQFFGQFILISNAILDFSRHEISLGWRCLRMICLYSTSDRRNIPMVVCPLWDWFCATNIHCDFCNLNKFLVSNLLFVQSLDSTFSFAPYYIVAPISLQRKDAGWHSADNTLFKPFFTIYHLSPQKFSPLFTSFQSFSSLLLVPLYYLLTLFFNKGVRISVET